MAWPTDDGALGRSRSSASDRFVCRDRARVQRTYRMLNQRIGIFTSLPLRALDKLTLQNKLNEIGRS